MTAEIENNTKQIRLRFIQGTLEVNKIISERKTPAERISDPHYKCLDEMQFLLDTCKALLASRARLREALNKCSDVWCRHPDIKTVELNLYRDWCADCSTWVRRGEEGNIPRETLELDAREFGEK